MALCLMFVQRSKKSNVNKFFVSEEILPQTLSVLQTRSAYRIRVSYWKPPRFDFSKEFFEQYFNIQEIRSSL
jgi:glycine dehydrogenase